MDFKVLKRQNLSNIKIKFMLNIFYNPSYIKTNKVFLTRSFRHSVFLNYLLDFNYFFNFPVNENFIQSGPHKRINNLLKTFRNDKLVSFNKFKHDNHYIVQFDKFGQDVLDRIISKKNSSTKVLIGPLYDLEQNTKLNSLINKHNFIKKLVASERTYLNQPLKDSNFNLENAVICPSGVISEEDLLSNILSKSKNGECLIYFKKREKNDLEKLINFLEFKKQKYNLFEYGHYKNNELKRAAMTNSFGITLSCAESQGFAIQELMASNLPLLIWDQKTNNYGGLDLPASTVTTWNDNCGLIVDNFNSLKDNFEKFKNNLDSYNPANLVHERLTFEIFNKSLKELFDF